MAKKSVLNQKMPKNMLSSPGWSNFERGCMQALRNTPGGLRFHFWSSPISGDDDGELEHERNFYSEPLINVKNVKSASAQDDQRERDGSICEAASSAARWELSPFIFHLTSYTFHLSSNILHFTSHILHFFSLQLSGRLVSDVWNTSSSSALSARSPSLKFEINLKSFPQRNFHFLL